MAKPQDYIRRIMNKDNLTFVLISERAKAKGYNLSPNYIANMLQGHVKNPSIEGLKALAAGLRRSQKEVFAAFGVKVDSSAKRQPKLPTPQPQAPTPRKPQIGLVRSKKT